MRKAGLRASGIGFKVSGFTLIELLIVTTILVVITTLAIPRFRSSFEKFRLQSFHDKFMGLAKTAHELSILEDKIYRISIQDEPFQFCLQHETENKEERFQPLTGGAGRNQVMPDNYILRTNENNIYFFPDGSATPANIVFINNLGESMNIEIESTGKLIKSSS